MGPTRTSVMTAALLAFAPALFAHADDLAILSAAAVRPALIEVPALFAKATGHRVTVAFGNATAIEDKVTAGGRVDLVILPALQIDDLIERRFLDQANRTALGIVRLGVAVRAGSPQPTIGTPDELRRALLVAPSFGMADPADGSTSSAFLVKLIQELGIAEEMRIKTIFFPDGTKALEAVAKGDVALTIAPMTSIRVVAGVDLAGPLPEGIQLKTVYVAALTRKAASSQAALALMQVLASPEVAALLKEKGVDPP